MSPVVSLSTQCFEHTKEISLEFVKKLNTLVHWDFRKELRFGKRSYSWNNNNNDKNNVADE